MVAFKRTYDASWEYGQSLQHPNGYAVGLLDERGNDVPAVSDLHEISRDCPCDRCDAWYREHTDTEQE